MRSETLTLMLVNLAGIMEKADESLLPAVYKEVGEALKVDPTGLGSLTLFRSIVQSSCYPLAVYLAARHNRTHVIALGALLWSLATFLVAISSTYFQLAVSRGLNGIGLAIAIPAIQSLVADSTEDGNRGTAFGWLQLTSNLGSIIGGFCSVSIASKSFFGVPGWRIAFHLVALISIAVGLSVRLFASDPRSDAQIRHQTFASEIKELAREAQAVMKIPSFRIIVGQGVSGSFPWSALAVAPMWLELVGFSHQRTALLWTVFTVACSVGGLFGGKMGDFLAARFPDSGRIVLSQISSGSAIPLAAVLLLGLPDDPASGFVHGLVLFVMGLSISWNGPATNGPIFAEIVPEKSRTSIYALDRTFETILASFAPPVVGLLAQHVYGYKPIPNGSSSVAEIEKDRQNAASLAKALYTAIGIPMAICCFIYSFLYRTYPRDRDRARMSALVESEIRGFENLNDFRLENIGIFEGTGSNGSKERSEIGTAHELEDGIDLDDSDEKNLLSSQLTFSNISK